MRSLFAAALAGLLCATCSTGPDARTDTAPSAEKPVASQESQPESQPVAAAGRDPADIAAMQSSLKMLQAEKRLREMIRRGEIKVKGRVLTFEEISNWKYDEGLKGAPKGIKQLSGKPVTMLGFMMPIDAIENIEQFLLVGSLWACCFGQPPDTNGYVRVVVKGKPLDYQFDPIQVEGKFVVSETIEDGFCVDIYQLEMSKLTKI